MTNSQLVLFLMFVNSFVNASAGETNSPVFDNSVVSNDIDFITSEDPSYYQSLKFLGRAQREMPDKRSEQLLDNSAFVFEVTFSDCIIPIWAHNTFQNQQIAEKYVRMLTAPLGQLPAIMRTRLSHVVVQQGNVPAYAEDEGNFFVVYSENIDARVREHDLEETVFHESVHATLDYRHGSTKVWQDAQARDRAFVTTYAQMNPAKEDLAESALFVVTLTEHPDRLPEKVKAWLLENQANRINFIQAIMSGE